MDDEKKKVDPVLRIATVVVVLAAAGVLIGASGKHPHSYYIGAPVAGMFGGGAPGLARGRPGRQVGLGACAVGDTVQSHCANSLFPRDLADLDIAAAVVMVLAVAVMEMATLLRKKQ